MSDIKLVLFAVTCEKCDKKGKKKKKKSRKILNKYFITVLQMQGNLFNSFFMHAWHRLAHTVSCCCGLVCITGTTDAVTCQSVSILNLRIVKPIHWTDPVFEVLRIHYKCFVTPLVKTGLWLSLIIQFKYVSIPVPHERKPGAVTVVNFKINLLLKYQL